MGKHRNQVRDGLCLRLEIAAAYPTSRNSLFQRPPDSEARQDAQSSSSISQLIGVGGGNERGMVWRLRTNQTLRAAVSHPLRTTACFLVGCSTIHDTGQTGTGIGTWMGTGTGLQGLSQGIIHPSSEDRPDQYVQYTAVHQRRRIVLVRALSLAWEIRTSVTAGFQRAVGWPLINLEITMADR